jgi:hypothetical protein
MTILSERGIIDVLRGIAPAALSETVLVALPDPDLAESGARIISRGREAAEAALRRDAERYSSRVPVLRCESGEEIAVEFVEETAGGVAASSVVVLRLNGQEIVRVLAFRHDHVPMRVVRQPSVRTTSDGAASVVRRYLDHLEAGRSAEAAACFAGDAIYSFPPRAGSGERGTIAGRSAIEEAFVARGVNAARHVIQGITSSDQWGGFIVAGRVTGLPGGTSASFVSCASIGDGLIQRYVAQMCIPEVPA